MKKPGEQFHPSRDQRPAEYSIESRGVQVMGSGLYEDEADLRGATGFWKSEGEDHPLLHPMQGRLFDAEQHEKGQRLALGRQGVMVRRLRWNEGVRRRCGDAKIPTSHLQPRPGKQETRFDVTNEGAGWEGADYGGFYRGPATAAPKEEELMRAYRGIHLHELFVHGLHRRHLGEMPVCDT